MFITVPEVQYLLPFCYFTSVVRDIPVKMDSFYILSILLALLAVWTSGWKMSDIHVSKFEKFQLGDRMTEKERKENVKFFLFTRSNSIVPKEMLRDDESSYDGFNPDHVTHILIHGWICPYKILFGSKDAILADHDYNVIVVSWPSYNLVYDVSKKDTEIVGECIAQFLDKLVEKKALNLKNVNIVGHSLGAHTAGVVGNRLTKGKLGRITGLDPAGPLFIGDKTPLENKLSPDDAECVQVIHTNDDTLGLPENVGKTDFFPNGGDTQLGCVDDVMGICSHMRAIELYEQWMKKDTTYVAVECDSWEEYEDGNCTENGKAIMAEDVNGQCPEGNFFLKVSGSPPYKQLELGSEE